MTDAERLTRHIFPKFDDISTFTVRVFNQLRTVRRVGAIEVRGFSPGTLIFTDCNNPMQNVLCDESRIQAWRKNCED